MLRRMRGMTGSTRAGLERSMPVLVFQAECLGCMAVQAERGPFSHEFRLSVLLQVAGAALTAAKGFMNDVAQQSGR